jgi:acyl carrier protein phosphodiesterase
MNYLGHLFFSGDDKDLMICNLYGDHVKGQKYMSYPSKIREGILLHREIDHYIDNHPEVLALKKLLYSDLPKVSSIAVDLYFDHLLAKNWKKYHNEELSNFLNSFFQFSSKYESLMKDEFKEFLIHLRLNRWLDHYSSSYGLDKLCRGVSTKLSFQNKLIEAAKYFEFFEKEIEFAFDAFMFDACRHFNVSNLHVR